MKSKSVLLEGALIMSVFSIGTKLLGVLLRLFLTARIGSEGMGLYQLIMSVYGLFAAVSTAGLTVSVSRVCAGDEEHSRATLRASFVLGGGISLAASGVLCLFASVPAKLFLKDAQTAQALRILALSMPFMALSACFKGYFLAHRKVARCSSCSFFEQCVKFAVMAVFLNVYFKNTTDIHKLCVGIVCGVTVGEACSFFYLLLSERIFDKNRHFSTTNRVSKGKALRSVHFPIALSVLITSLLHTVESLLIPGAFEKFGGDRAKALSEFGVIRGMVIPLLFFPFAFLSGLVSVMIPEISRKQATEGVEARDAQIRKILTLTVFFGIFAGGLFFFLPEELGETFYPGQRTEKALRLLALVNPFMYVQTICDGLLKATDGQKYSLRYSIYNSVLRLFVLVTLIPFCGANGYLALLMISNVLECILCYRRLHFYVSFRLPRKGGVVRALLCCVFAGICARGVLTLPFFPIPLSAAMAGSSVFAGVFLLTMYRPITEAMK